MEPNPNVKSAYCAEVRQYATDLLGYLGKSGGTVPGGFTTKVFELWAAADMDNKAAIAGAWPFIAVALHANRQGGRSWSATSPESRATMTTPTPYLPDPRDHPQERAMPVRARSTSTSAATSPPTPWRRLLTTPERTSPQDCATQ
jgi:hypothetical protein